jgi:hypothetical protein
MADYVFSQASGLNEGVFGRVIDPMMMMLEKKGEAFEQQSLVPLLYVKDSVKTKTTSLGSMTSMMGPQPVGEGGDYPTDGFQEGYRKVLEVETWKQEFEVTKEAADDNDQIQLVNKPIAQLTAWYRAVELFAIRMYGEAVKGNATFKVFNKTFDTKCADGVTLFSTAHTSKTGRKGNQSNLFSDAFSADALAEIECRMHAFADDNGNILDVTPSTILIPSIGSLKKAVFGAIGADVDPDTANNGANFLCGRWNVIVSPYMNAYCTETNPAPWIVLSKSYNDTNIGAIWLDREKMNIRNTIEGNDNLKVKIRGRFGAGFIDWRFAACGGISGGTQMIAST